MTVPPPPADERYASWLYPLVTHHTPWWSRPLRCKVGLHDWVRRGGVYVPGPTAAEWAKDSRAKDGRPPPTGYTTDRFEQCWGCDATRPGWSPEPYRGPAAEPWPECAVCGHRLGEHKPDGSCAACARDWRPGTLDSPPCMWSRT